MPLFRKAVPLARGANIRDSRPWEIDTGKTHLLALPTLVIFLVVITNIRYTVTREETLPLRKTPTLSTVQTIARRHRSIAQKGTAKLGQLSR